MEPIAIATWPFGRNAAETAGRILRDGGAALDAALAGAQAVEDDASVRSVGYGAMANRIGGVSRDAGVMCGRTLNCGAVAGLEHIRHTAAVARKVMEKTPHVFLVGDGALWFALEQGFPMQTHHTPESVAEWYEKHPGKVKNASGDGQPLLITDAIGLPADANNHDTVTVLARDARGDFGGVCTTSGLAYKMPGRVGDSPVIGGGLYVDNDAGAAGATGVGEEIIRAGGSLLIVEEMRSGASAQAAVEKAIRRVNAIAKRRNRKPDVVCFLALDRDNRFGAACTAGSNFDYALYANGTVTLTRAVEVLP
jgi:isoaspartyl peptidase/L-asparaginase-like protein (Ntn-hydrolase superfamily)